MFLCGNQLMSLLNSIYFIDDRWFEMEMEYLYGGHNLGMTKILSHIIILIW